MHGLLVSFSRNLRRTLRGTSLGDALSRSLIRPQYWKPSWDAARTLWFAYGHLKSVRTQRSIDAAGEPIPWYTYPAIEYLKQFDFDWMKIFEYGCGSSTLFWAQRAEHVVGVEHDDGWFRTVRESVPSNCTLLFRPDLRTYVDAIQQFSDGFDVIVIDGPARGQTRFRCARRALEHLRSGGLIILDNSDWLSTTARLLRESGLLQVDMSGFCPIGSTTHTTSLFFDRTCRLMPRDGRQPHVSAGGGEPADNWETFVPPSPPEQIVEWEPGLSIGWITRRVCVCKITPQGSSQFEIGLRELPSGKASVFVYDRQAGRILLGALSLRAWTDFEPLVMQLEQMPWQEFCAYVRRSPVRWYLLDDSEQSHRESRANQLRTGDPG
jgi:hypothetical protein